MKPTSEDDAYVTAQEAAKQLGVKLATLYAYASRGLVRSAPEAGTKRRLYRRADIERLKARHDARAGHGPVAAGALRWGEPVLDSAITQITPDGPRYRGHLATDLARQGVPFESVAELLWTGTLPPESPRWPVDGLGAPADALAAALDRDTAPLTPLMLAVPALAAADPARFSAPPEAELPRARTLLRRLAASLALGRGRRNLEAALKADTMARTVAMALGMRGPSKAERLIDMALVLLADHELNTSSFAARVTASTGSDLYACVAAALAALSGPLHGGASDRAEALIREVGRPERAAEILQARARRGEGVPGFGHRFYEAGDPRAVVLLEATRALAPRNTAVQTLLAVVEAMEATRGEKPSVDLALVAAAAALELPAGSSVALFALGRAAGWVAHVLEQRQMGVLLRPRARYVGP